MKNLFHTTYDNSSHTTKAEYDSFIIRKVTKKQESQLHAMGEKYNISLKNRGLPKWMNFLNRTAFFVTLTSFVFMIVSIVESLASEKNNFWKEYLWIEMIFGISALIFIISIILNFIYRKISLKKNKSVSAKDTFDEILCTSKKFLDIPATAKSIEVLMENNTTKKTEKIKKYSNILLTVFIEKDMLCFADLYMVIGIPLKNLSDFELIEEKCNLKYWHKNESELSINGVKPIARPIRYFQMDHYAVLKTNLLNKELGIFLPAYELEILKNILKEERE